MTINQSHAPTSLPTVQETIGAPLPAHTPTPLLRCVLEYMSAHDRQVLQEAGPRMDVIATDLVGHARELLHNESFRRVFMEIAWHSVHSFTIPRSSPLTTDLVPRVSDLDRSRHGWETRAPREFVADQGNRRRDQIINRLEVIGQKLSQAGLAGLGNKEHLSLLQVSEAVVKFRMSSIQERQRELHERKVLDVAVSSVVELSKRLESTFPADLMPHATRILTCVFAHRLAHLESVGLIHTGGNFSRAIEARLKTYGADLALFDTKGSLDSVQALVKSESVTDLTTDLAALVPAAVVSTVRDLASQSERYAVERWIIENREAIEARYIDLMVSSVFAIPTTPSQFVPAIKAAKFSTELVRKISSIANRETIDPSDIIYIHNRAHLAPRIFEAAAISKASHMVVLGKMPQHLDTTDPDTQELMSKVLMLSKSEKALAGITSIGEYFGSTDSLLKAELEGTGVSCEARCSDEKIPPEIVELERRTKGTAAWVVNSLGLIRYVLVFDGALAPAEQDWVSGKLADGIVGATPKREIRCFNVSNELQGSMQAQPTAAEILAPQGAPAKSKKEPEVQKVEVPHIPATPTHLFPDEVRKDLLAWLSIADEAELFEYDPSFSGSADGRAIQEALRRAAKGQVVNAKAARAIRRLPALLSDERHQPVLSKPYLHDLRSELASILNGLAS